MKVNKQVPNTKTSKGSSSLYYKIPDGACELQDLIEHKNMNFARGNMFKALYRLGDKEGQDFIDDIDKIIWFAIREKSRISGRSIESLVDEIDDDFMAG